MKKRVLFIDRDGTILVEPKPDLQIDSLEKFAFVPGAIAALHRIVTDLEYDLVMVTNQDGLGTDSFPEETFWPLQNLMINTLSSEGIHFETVHIDGSFDHEKKETRKPGVGMLKSYLSGEYDLENSFVIGDRATDVQLAQNIGCQSIQIARRPIKEATFGTSDWMAIYHYLKGLTGRTATIERNTNETKIRIELNLDGTGQSQINTGLGFFDHMLEQLARHSGCDLRMLVKGDLHIDEHHTIEDTAIALGEAFNQALGDKKGINRYGFMLPMDDVLAQVAIDFGGRPWLVWEAEFMREKIGEMPTEMFHHFFKSFSDASKCNLNIKAEGQNEHHKIEAIFKCLARAIGMAIKKEGSQLPSTKGVL